MICKMNNLRQIAIISNIISERLIHYNIHGVCLYVTVLFSEALKKRNIEHKTIMGYLNLNEKFSTLHFFIEVNGSIVDPTVCSNAIMGLSEKGGTYQYSKKPIYEILDESEEERLNKLYQIFLSSGNEVFWSNLPSDILKSVRYFIADIRQIFKL
jgi:hypothetical protein